MPDASPTPSRAALLAPLLPLIVFAVVDAVVTDTRVSVVAGVAFAVGQVAITWIRSRRIDRLVLLDAALVALLGGVSIAFDDALFFELKPAISDGVGLAVMIGLLLAPAPVFVAYVSRLSPGRPLEAEAVRLLRQTFALVAVASAVHGGAVVFAALRASREVWTLVAGPGFYACVVPAALGPGLVARWRGRRTPPSV